MREAETKRGGERERKREKRGTNVNKRREISLRGRDQTGAGVVMTITVFLISR